MPTYSLRAGNRGFALLELSAAAVLILAAVVLSSIVFPDLRRRARLAGSIQNLQQIGASAFSYAHDNDNRVFSFTWEPGEHRCGDYSFPVSSTYLDAAADQAVCIMRERGHRTDIVSIRGWIPHILYNHLVLADYLAQDLPSPVFVSPGDAPRLAWYRATVDHPGDQGQAYFSLTCRPSDSGNLGKRWAYSSSYEVQPSFFSPDALVYTPEGTPIPTLVQDPMGHRYYNPGSALTVLGRRRMDEVRHPSHKAMMYETNQRFFGAREMYFLYPDARVPVLHADGAASVRSIARANAGFFPNSPQSSGATRVYYNPQLSWETPSRSGAAEFVNGVIRWTRSGLRGRDFQGPEVPWVP